MSTVKPLAIFQPLPSEVQEIIISNCDANSLVALSGVNISGSENLTNEIFFKAYFIKQHPRLKPYDRLFTVLCSTHPNNCWKVVCQIMHFPKSPRIATRISPSFTQEAVEKIHLQIVKCEQIDKSICGLRFEDSNSPIDRRWKEFKKYEQEHNTAVNELTPLLNQLCHAMELEFEGKEVRLSFFEYVKIHYQFDGDEKLLSSSYEEFLEKSPAENQVISRDQFSYCQRKTEINLLLLTIEKLKTQERQSHSKYSHLEQLRKGNERKKEQLTKDLANPGEAHIKTLSAEWHKALELETKLTNTASLEACTALIADLIKNPEKLTPEAHQKIRGFINSCEYSLRTRIWENLYHLCANGAIEDSWAEKHCMDHLRKLDVLVYELYRNSRQYLNGEGPQYMSPVSALINSDLDGDYSI